MSAVSTATAPIRTEERNAFTRILVPFLGSLATLAAIYAALVWIVNPQGEFKTKLFPRVRTDWRNEKMDLFRAYAQAGPVDGLILGSSRTMNLNPGRLQALVHRRFFNFGLASATAEDYLAAYRFVRSEGQRPRDVTISLDIDALSNDFDPKPGELTTYAIAQYQAPLPERIATDVTHYFRFYFARDIAYSLYLKVHPQPPIAVLQNDGTLRYVKHERERASGTFRLDRRSMDSCIAQRIEQMSRMTALDARRQNYLETTIREAQRDGATVVLWIPSMHPFTVQALDQQTDFARLSDLTRAYVDELHVKYGIATFDFSRLENYGGTASGFYDCGHIDESNAQRIEQRLAAVLR